MKKEKRVRRESSGGAVKNQSQKTTPQEKYRRLAILRVLDSNRTQFSLGIRTIRVYLEPFAINPRDREIEAALNHLTGEGLAEKSILKGEIPAWKITPKGRQFLDKLERDMCGSGIPAKAQAENPGSGAVKAESPFHAFQAKSLSIVEWVASLKRRAKSKKQRALLGVLEREVTDLVLKALKVTDTPTWRVNPRNLHPSSMDKFLLDGIAGLDSDRCRKLMYLCEEWGFELRGDLALKDGAFSVLVLPFLGELSGEEKTALGAIYGRWGDMLRDEKNRRFKLHKA